MASAIGAALISTILQPMVDKAMDIFKDKGKGIGRSINIKRDISNLQITLRMIQGIVQVAEEKQIDKQGKPTVFIQNWLRDLVDIGYEARDVLDDFLTFSSCVIRAEEASNPVNFISSFMLSYFGGSSSDTSKLPLAILNRLANEIKRVRERFDEKKKEAETFKTLKSVVGGGSESVSKYRRPEVGPLINKQSDVLFLGREEMKEGIMERILHPSEDNRVHVVVIWGMGGIGKTTLAQSIYNDERVKEDDYPTKNRRWLCVGVNKFSAEKVIREIVNDQNTISIPNLQTKLEYKLRGDRFLIVLDDVWDVDGSEWDLLFNPLTNVGKGGLIIITRRERDLCPAAITIQTAYNLKPLSEEDSWSIFESYAYVNGKADGTSELKPIGEEIVKKLNGLPLALKVVGRSLLNKDSSTWTDFLESKLTKDDEVMSALRWSYNHLPRHLKMCFTYCSLFPKDHVFDNEKVLVQMWMAHDLIQKEERKRPEDVGAQYFEELVNASLLQCVDGKYVMHDLIHDLAVLVSNGEFATANSSLTNDQMKKVRHITITPGDYSKIPHLCNIEKLLTLYTVRSGKEDPERSDDYRETSTTPLKKDILEVFRQSKSLRVLVLSNKHICEIPECISGLKHLRYLDVKETNVKSLRDSLCHLYHLQMLAAPPDAVLPRDIVNLVNLRYLRANLSTCKGVGKLTSLQELSSIHVCKDDNIGDLGDITTLRGKLRIKGLENVSSLGYYVGALMEKQTNIHKLELEFDQHFAKSTISAQVLDALGCPPNLTYLQIDGYTGLKLPEDLFQLKSRKHKFAKPQTLRSLKDLRISFCSKIELMDFSCLPSLRHLDVSHCHELNSISGLAAVKYLRIFNCEKLNSVSTNFHGLDSLEELEILVCPLLESIREEVISTSSSSSSSTLSSKSSPWSGLLRFDTDNEQIFRNILNQDLISNIRDIVITRNDKLVECLGEIMKNSSHKLKSLKDLFIMDCKQLQSLPTGCLPHSLEFLHLVDCQQLKSLPDGFLPTSLRHLIIEGCLLLSESGLEWHKTFNESGDQPILWKEILP